MKKLNFIAIIMTCVLLFTGCGSKKEESKKIDNSDNKSVVEDQIFEGLEFVNVSAKDGIIKTVVINNTGYTYEGSKFKMTIMDEEGNVLIEETDEVKDKVETGKTKTIETKTKADLTKAASIEYSIVSE